MTDYYDDAGEENVDYIDLEDEDEDEDEDDDDLNPEPHNQIVRVTGEERKFLPRMTSYEWARTNGTRAAQIENGSIVGIDVPSNKTDSLQISEFELQNNECPLFLGRPDGDGGKMEVWHTKELVIIDAGLQRMAPTPIQMIPKLSIEQILNYEGRLPQLREFSNKHRGCIIEEEKKVEKEEGTKKKLKNEKEESKTKKLEKEEESNKKLEEEEEEKNEVKKTKTIPKPIKKILKK